MHKHIKVAVTGAAGHIGYALLFRIASGQMFGMDTTLDLHLIEIEPALPALQGIIMELEDCAFPLLKNVSATADLNAGFKDVNWAILVGAAPRKEGMERADLLKMNGNIFKTQAIAINNHAAANVQVFVVGNPCNTNALIAMQHAPEVPRHRFYAMTMLDQNRAQTQLAKKANVPVSAVENMIIWGNHSSTQYPDFYHATIHGKPVTEVITDSVWLQNEFIATVQKRGAAVIKARGASSAASAANAVVDSIYSLTHPGKIFSVGCCSEGQYGIDPGLIFSFPCEYQHDKLHICDHWQHNAFSQQKLQLTLEELRQERDAVKALGLI